MTQRVRSAKIRLRDFQPFEDTTVEATGLTVVCGENNVGKTSVFRGIDSVVNNSRHGDRDVRWGSEEGKSVVGLTLEMGDGTLVEAIRTKPAEGGASYYLDGELFEAVGRSPVRDVQERLGMLPMETKNDNHQLNFQRSRKMFAIDLSPQRLFDLVNELMPQKEIVTVLSQMKADSTAAKKGAERADESAANEDAIADGLEKDVSRLSVMDGGTDYRGDLARSVAEVDRIADVAEKARVALEIEGKLSEVTVRLSGAVEAVSGLDATAQEELDRTKALVGAVSKAREASSAAQRITGVRDGVAAALEACAAPLSELRKFDADPAEMKRVVEKARRISATAESQAEVVSELKPAVERASMAAAEADEAFESATKMARVPELLRIARSAPDAGVVAGIAEAAERVEEAWVAAVRLFDEVGNLPSAVKDVSERIRRAEADLVVLRAEGERLVAERDQISTLIAELDAEGEKCEKCGAPVDENGMYAGEL